MDGKNEINFINFTLILRVVANIVGMYTIQKKIVKKYSYFLFCIKILEKSVSTYFAETLVLKYFSENLTALNF